MYSIKKVSEILGIPTVTIRAWENRYQIITPVRSKGGHRLYSESDIDTLTWLKSQLTDHNMKIGEAVYLLKQKELETPSMESQASHISKTCRDLIENLYKDLIDFNTTSSHQTIDLAFSIYHYEDVFHNIFTPVLVQLGMNWENREISTAQEHFSTQLIMQRILQFFRILPIHPQLPKAIALCPEGEHHHIGLMLFSLFLRTKGLEVIYLGPNTPLGELASLIEEKNISVIAVSISDPKYVEMMESWVEATLRKFPDLIFALGGTGFNQYTAQLSRYVQSTNQADWEAWYQAAIVKPNHAFFARR
ncbi:MerR family transcriptional regulator [Paenibacillus radicis (ex Xue et al. 2023)]|uniref:MerR family transcriptional regulator n=1 Tax=Paenibacillus radicis (ex Xue et al. 2023) TaxID=2972489 RepID=A0ABT1YKH3_9BACL|nr:MerR family transcriptional regulator [Paenibacillus radicis (ex Xue et al. 2023)]MCR8633684.1 MerR family transcriptional regulator [Paenibacillus radicis (ex Xue et al. 2023)]